MNKRILCAILILCLIMSLIGCAPKKMGVFTEDPTNSSTPHHGTPNNNDKDKSEKESEEATSNSVTDEKLENSFVKTDENSISEVLLSSGKSSYLYFRSLVSRDYTFDQLCKCSYSFNIEEFLNYFGVDYNFKNQLFGVKQSLFDCPWNPESVIYSVTVKMEDVVDDAPSNFVFCVDVSESMAREDVLPLFKKIFPHFVSELDENDTVSIVTFTGTPQIILGGCQGDNADDILAAVQSLELNNGANGNADIEPAYDIAKSHFIEGGNNRVIIVSDGDISGKLTPVVEKNAKDGIFTSVLGFGYSNYKNEKLESFASVGDGRYYFIDCESQGEMIMGEEIFKPVHFEIENLVARLEFNSEYISEYRLIGYAQNSDGKDEETDIDVSNKIYAGDVMTLCYELKFTSEEIPESAEIAALNIKGTYCEDGSHVIFPAIVTTDFYAADADENMKFMACVIESVMILQNSEFIGNLTLVDVFETLETLDFEEYPEREEFKLLIKKIITANK